MTTEEVIEAIKTNKKYKIYKSREFRTLRLQVLKTFHYECQRCKESNKITSAVLVHHAQEVTKHPELAFEEFYIDKNGIKQRNLIPLCKECHEAIHHRYGFRPNQTKSEQNFINEERW